EFAGELTLLKSILPGIDETNCDFEEDIRLIEKLLYDNSSPHPPEEFVSANSDAKIESFSPSSILVKDSDSLMEEIDLFCTPDFPMSSGIVDKDYDSKRDILIPKELPSNNTLSFAEKDLSSRLIMSLNQATMKTIILIHMIHRVFHNNIFVVPAVGDYTSAITLDEPVLSTEEPDNSLSIEDEHLDTIPATESDEFIKSSVENLILIPSESEGGIEASNDNPIPFYDPIISGTPPNLTPS
nr:hypothetical protein [Tanacetum cinerariifolium]